MIKICNTSCVGHKILYTEVVSKDWFALRKFLWQEMFLWTFSFKKTKTACSVSKVPQSTDRVYSGAGWVGDTPQCTVYRRSSRLHPESVHDSSTGGPAQSWRRCENQGIVWPSKGPAPQSPAHRAGQSKSRSQGTSPPGDRNLYV